MHRLLFADGAYTGVSGDEMVEEEAAGLGLAMPDDAVAAIGSALGRAGACGNLRQRIRRRFGSDRRNRPDGWHGPD